MEQMKNKFEEIININTINTTECPICLDSIIDENNENKTKCCGQLIHEECLNKSLESTKGHCPLCRKYNFSKTLHNNIHNIHNSSENHIIQSNQIIINPNHEIRIIRFQFTIEKILFCFFCLAIAWIPPVIMHQVNENVKLMQRNQAMNYSSNHTFN